MVPPEHHLPFFDTPLGFTLVVLAIVTGFYLFIGKIKTPADYHRQGVAIQEQAEKQKTTKMQQSSQEAVENGKKGEKIEQVSWRRVRVVVRREEWIFWVISCHAAGKWTAVKVAVVYIGPSVCHRAFVQTREGIIHLFARVEGV